MKPIKAVLVLQSVPSYPAIFLGFTGRPRKFPSNTGATRVAVPIDNEHVRGIGIGIVVWPLEDGEPKPGWGPATDTVEDIRPGSTVTRSYEERQRKPDDLEAQEGQRAIAVHALENLAMSDSGIVMLRRLLREQIKRVENGLDPINVARAADAARGIPTGAWNTVLTPDEAASPHADAL